jgi:hypothetical protein
MLVRSGMTIRTPETARPCSVRQTGYEVPNSSATFTWEILRAGTPRGVWSTVLSCLEGDNTQDCIDLARVCVFLRFARDADIDLTSLDHKFPALLDAKLPFEDMTDPIVPYFLRRKARAGRNDVIGDHDGSVTRK